MESQNNSSSSSLKQPTPSNRNESRESKRRIEFESAEDISNFYLKKTAFQLNDILKCVEDTHSRYECKEQIQALSMNLYNYRSEVSKFVEKSSLLTNPNNLLFPPQIFSPPTIVYREYKGDSNSPESIHTRFKSFSDNRTMNNSAYNPHDENTPLNMFQSVADGVIRVGSSLIRKIIGRGED